MSSLRDLITRLQEKYDDKDSFFASEGDYAFFKELLPAKVEPQRESSPPPKAVPVSVPQPLSPKVMISPAVELKVPEPIVTSAKGPSSYFENLRAVVAKAAPQLALKEAVPDDSMAKKIGSLWQEHLQDVHVAILSFGAQGNELAFLQNVAAAVSSLLAPAQVIDGMKMEREKKWALFFEKTPLKLVLAPPLNAWREKTVAAHFRENPTDRTSTLGPAPALLMRPLREYLQTPTLKRDLWKALVSHLSS